MAEYRTIALSDPQFERDCLRLLTFKSPALKGRGDVSIFVPPGCESGQNLPLVVLLHGVYASHWAWSLMGGAHMTALDLINHGLIGPMVIAMPSDGLWGDGTGYVPHASADYEKWIMDDVVGCVTEVIPCLGADSELFLAGLSVGGYGALRLGAKCARRVSGISAHSSLTHLDQLALFVEEPIAAYKTSAEDLSVLHWVKKNKDILPPTRFDCGTSDVLLEDNRQLHCELAALGIQHQYVEFEGGHEWPYWREHLKDSLIFFERERGNQSEKIAHINQPGQSMKKDLTTL